MLKTLLIGLALLASALPSYAGGIMMMGGGVASTSATNYTNDANILSYWNFEEDGTADRVDGNSTNNNDLVPNATTPQSATHIQGSYSIDIEESDYRQLTVADADLNPSTFPGKTTTGATNTITVGGWFRPESQLGDMWVIHKGIETNNFSFGIGVTAATNRWKAGWTNNGWGTVSTTTDSNKTVTNDTWYFVVATFSSTTTSLYVAASGDSSTTVVTSTDNPSFYLGGGALGISGDAYRWDGLVDECFIFNRVLSKSEIDAILNHGLAGDR